MTVSTICRCGHQLALHQTFGNMVRACTDVSCDCLGYAPKVLKPLTHQEDEAILRGLRQCLEEMKGGVEVMPPDERVIQVGE